MKFSHFWINENDVIIWEEGEISVGNLNLLGRVKSYSCIASSAIQTVQFLQSTLNIQTSLSLVF